MPFVDLGQTHGPLKVALLAEVSALLDLGIHERVRHRQLRESLRVLV